MGDGDLAAVEAVLKEAGPRGFRRVSPQDVVTAEWVRLKCQFGCGGYGRCLTCPPHSPEPARTRAILDEYSAAYLLWWGAQHTGREELAEIERRTFLLGFHKAFMFAEGPCRLCEPCPLEPPCRHAGVARPSMEACGIDVYETAHRAGFPLKVVRTHRQRPNFYSLLLVD